MFSVSNPKYKFKEDFIAKLCTNFIESYTTKTPCKSYEDLVFKKGDVMESVKNVNIVNPDIISGFAKMTPFQVPLSVLEKVDDSIPITDVVQGNPDVVKAQKKNVADTEEKRVKMMFIVPTIAILAIIWIYGIKKL
jgi:hypothetical protein